MNKTPEQILKEYLSAKAKERWSCPEYRAKQMEARRKRWADPEARARNAEAQRIRRERERGDKSCES